MELKAIDNGRVVYLTHAWRPKGQLFLPAALEALLNRYHFQKFPTQEELLSDTILFQHGVFEDVGINEFGIYEDGLVVASRADTDFLDRFIEDVLTWAEATFELIEVDIPPKEHHYESALIVSMKIKGSFPHLANLNQSLTLSQEKYGLRPFEFAFSALQVANDATMYGGKKPIPFTLARRVNVPFDADIYYATAPLKTGDHLLALEALERDLS
jgi:hypothetical protein